MNTNDDIILYSTIEQQIEKLKSQNLIIEDENRARTVLKLYGYSNLIKGYREPYVIKSGDSITYRSGVSLDQIESLYLLDKHLRNSVMAAMLDLEENLKAACADVIASSFGTHQDDYLQFSNYRDKRRRRPQFELGSILNTMKHTIETSDKNPILHYRQEHGTIPPWILFKNVYFSTIINFINLFKTPEKNLLIHHLYNVDKLPFTLEQLNRVMMNTLFICLEYRNLAAHGGRTYNHICESTIDYNVFSFDRNTSPHGFNLLLFLLSQFEYKDPFRILADSLTYEVNRHCQHFPEDVTYLGRILNVDIKSETVGFITQNSNKYHFNPHCSGIMNTTKVPVEKLKEQGYIPCKKCTK